MAGNEGNEKITRARMRASHANRDQAINRLKAAFVQGRLTKDELVTRAAQASSARTYADLAALTADLPRRARSRPQPAHPGTAPAAGAPRHQGGRGRGRPDSGGVHDAGRTDGRVRYARRCGCVHFRGSRRRGRHRRFRPHSRGSQARGPPPEPLRRPATPAPIPRHIRPSPTTRHRTPADRPRSSRRRGRALPAARRPPPAARRPAIAATAMSVANGLWESAASGCSYELPQAGKAAQSSRMQRWSCENGRQVRW